MTDLNDRQIEIARAASPAWRFWKNSTGCGVSNGLNMTICGEADAAHIAANPPAVTIAYAEVAKAGKKAITGHLVGWHSPGLTESCCIECDGEGMTDYDITHRPDCSVGRFFAALTHLDEVLEANSHE